MSDYPQAPSLLKREYQRALSVYQNNRHQLHLVEQNVKLLRANGPLLPTDFIAASRIPFDKNNLPKETHWEWAQSSSRVLVYLDECTFVTFWKVNTRKKNLPESKLRKPPSLKVWLYEIHSSKEVDQYFVWCEKGHEARGIDTEIGYIFPDKLSISDLSFLAHYVDVSTACELGWFGKI